MLLTIIINLISVFIFLYILWTRLKEEYSSSLIFSAGFTISAFVVLGNIITFRLFPKYWFWASFLGVAIGIIISIYKYKFSFYEFCDSVIISLHPWLGLILLDRFATTLDVRVLVLFSQVVFTAIMYFVFNKHYKSFSWYKSGRVGFSGFAVVGIFFILRSVIALTFSNMLSFIGSSDAIVSGAMSFIAFLVLFNLSKSGN